MKVERFRPIENGGALKASYHLIFRPTGVWHLNLCLFKKETGQTWFGYPNRSYINKEGLKKFLKDSYPSDEDRPDFEHIMKEYLLANYPVTRDIFADNASIQEQYVTTPVPGAPESSVETLPF